MIGERLHHFHFHIFLSKMKTYDIIDNENGIGITAISEIKIYNQKHIDNYRNPLKQYFGKQ